MKFGRFLQSMGCLALAAVMLSGCAGTSTVPADSKMPSTDRQTKPPSTQLTSVSSVSETNTPVTSIPETAIPETTAPETAIPETTVPETTVSETAVPQTSTAAISTAAGPEADDPVCSEIDRLIGQMTLREKVGQLFFVRPESLNEGQTATLLNGTMKSMLKDYPVGGVVMFSRNIISPDQIISFNQALQEASEIPLVISVDEEGGAVARLANHDAFDLPTYKSAADVGKSGDASDALAMGQTIGAYLYRYGFNMDFAPIADVNTNPNNPVIGQRAFSSDAETAALMADAMAEGLRQEGITPVFKHFPGHGDTAEDSHYGIAVSYKTKSEMEDCEWLPFQKAGSEDCIMMGHIAVPNLTGDQTPASLSYEVVTEILRNEWGYEGVIITDSLEMGAITQTYGVGEASVQAFLAGCDVLMMPSNLEEAFDAILDAVECGRISEARLDQSVRRILSLKY